MGKRLALVFLAAFAMATAAESHKVTLFQPSVVGGAELKAGDYRLEVQDSKVVILGGKQPVEAAVTVEQSGQKFAATTVRGTSADGKYSIQEIRLGGTRTRLVFKP